ncbi:MAG TPA: hypothetical protein VH268_00165 [Solirubrobacterales bacterium]|nr:hypothetical protein [Solirubrobacterales bacterium]
MIQPDSVAAVIRLPRAEESWEAVIFSGLIPFLGAAAVLALLWRAIKSNPENDLPPEERLGANWVHGVPPGDDPAAEENPEQNPGQEKEGGPEGPPS